MKAVLLFLLLFSFTLTHAQSEQALVAQANKLEAALNENGALETFKQVLHIDPHNYYALWKSSELCSRIGARQATKDAKLDYFMAGKKYAETAIRVNPNAADGYYVLAVAMGKMAMTQSGKERINAVKEIRIYADMAVKINPQHGRAWHVLGKWNYEVSNLNFFEKAALKVVYGGLPDASLQQSIADYEKAKQLEPNFALNYLELAKAYKRNGDNAKAIDLLKKLPYLPNKTQDDTRIKAEGKQLLQKYLAES